MVNFLSNGYHCEHSSPFQVSFVRSHIVVMQWILDPSSSHFLTCRRIRERIFGKTEVV